MIRHRRVHGAGLSVMCPRSPFSSPSSSLCLPLAATQKARTEHANPSSHSTSTSVEPWSLPSECSVRVHTPIDVHAPAQPTPHIAQINHPSPLPTTPLALNFVLILPAAVTCKHHEDDDAVVWVGWARGRVRNDTERGLCKGRKQRVAIEEEGRRRVAWCWSWCFSSPRKPLVAAKRFPNLKCGDSRRRQHSMPCHTPRDAQGGSTQHTQAGKQGLALIERGGLAGSLPCHC